ncbi:hypothetical protein ZHAS_00007405 [Anopheles sinensis]|uniref:Ig-like domain-containing protein n=1 Tax=Anopheles sinensis TaxID=74873 RepID=A0A084VP21_ANOSI|nr:hypothetical protein ZHAS_00007405 [Anopheles sinensis]
MRVPKYAVKDRPVRLECLYDMEGEALYAVKWYKDGHEFYRFVPRDDPPTQIFPLHGLIVNAHDSTDSQVTLESIKRAAGGKYRCEVSAEAPSFQTVAHDEDMIVAVLPEEDPVISGGKPRYQLGEHVRVNCTSGRAKPAAQLTWYINSELADHTYVRQYPTIVSLTPDHLETSILGLEFRVKPKHFRHGDMKLKCLATIENVYWKSNEESVESDKPQKAPILESRKSGLSSTTRADRVHELCFTLVLTELRIPWQVVANSDALLECRFDMNNTELYAVKWYKDGHEFFRYLPRNKPTKQMFLLPDITIDLQKSDKNQVLLRNVTLASAGKYTCEVSAEAPAFLTVSGVGNMRVIGRTASFKSIKIRHCIHFSTFLLALPDEGPTITGAKPWYHAGDVVRVSCSSGRSKPATTLSWYVNDERVATSDMLQTYYTTVDERLQLERTILRLEFRVQPKHFKNGEMKLKCFAFLGHLDSLASESKEIIGQSKRDDPKTSESRLDLRPRNVFRKELDIKQGMD